MGPSLEVSAKYRFVLFKVWVETFETYLPICPLNTGCALIVRSSYYKFHCMLPHNPNFTCFFCLNLV